MKRKISVENGWIEDYKILSYEVLDENGEHIRYEFDVIDPNGKKIRECSNIEEARNVINQQPPSKGSGPDFDM